MSAIWICSLFDAHPALLLTSAAQKSQQPTYQRVEAQDMLLPSHTQGV